MKKTRKTNKPDVEPHCQPAEKQPVPPPPMEDGEPGDFIDQNFAIITVNEFTEETAKRFYRSVCKAHLMKQPILPVIIDSFGGDVYALLSMLADIEASDVPIATICKSKAMSCGAVLLSAGTPGYRFMHRDATVLIHEVSGVSGGKMEDLKIYTMELDKLNKLIMEKLAKNCKKSAAFFMKALHNKKNADFYLSGTEAKKMKIVDHLYIPIFRYQGDEIIFG